MVLSQLFLCTRFFQKQPQEVLYPIKKPFLKYSQEKESVLECPFNKVARLLACNFVKKRLQHWCFPVNTAKEQLRMVASVFYKNFLEPRDLLALSERSPGRHLPAQI